MAPLERRLRVNSRLEIPSSELRMSFARSGGPGGQNVNKVETKVVLHFSIPESQVLGERRKALLMARLGSRLTGRGEVVIHASRHRERGRNIEDACERLAATLREALLPVTTRRRTRPTAGSRRRRLDAKRRRSDLKRGRGAAKGRRGGDE